MYIKKTSRFNYFKITLNKKSCNGFWRTILFFLFFFLGLLGCVLWFGIFWRRRMIEFFKVEKGITVRVWFQGPFVTIPSITFYLVGTLLLVRVLVRQNTKILLEEWAENEEVENSQVREKTRTRKVLLCEKILQSHTIIFTSNLQLQNHYLQNFWLSKPSFTLKLENTKGSLVFSWYTKVQSVLDWNICKQRRTSFNRLGATLLPTK